MTSYKVIITTKNTTVQDLGTHWQCVAWILNPNPALSTWGNLFIFVSRRSGKPTSLGCFDHEEQAARAYDKMMLWCELHNSSGIKGGITNFDPAEYEKDLSWLQMVNQARVYSYTAMAKLVLCIAPVCNCVQACTSAQLAGGSVSMYATD